MADATSTVQYQTGFAPQIAPYAENLLGTAAGTMYQYQKDAGGQNTLDAQGMPIITGFQPMQQYGGDRYAQFTPMQQQSYQGAETMQPAYQLMGATGLAGLAGQQALNTQYNPMNYQTRSVTGNQGGWGGGMGGGMGASSGGGGAIPPGDDSQYGGPGRPGYDTGPDGKILGGMGALPAQQNPIDAYMSPYMQNVVQRQQQDASRQAAIAQQAQGAQAARSGAFGGSGDYLMRGQAAGNLARQKGDIQAKGLQDAYGQALNQFNQEQQQRQAAAQLNEQSRQYGAGLGLQGLQTALTGANTLGNLGTSQFGQQMDINKLQNTYGGQQQAQVQNMLSGNYQDFLNQQNYPYKQMAFMSDLLRGAPLSKQGETGYTAQPGMFQQLAGAGLTAYGASMKAGGGEIKSRPAGLAELAIYKMA
jgi:hypothetical protein